MKMVQLERNLILQIKNRWGPAQSAADLCLSMGTNLFAKSSQVTGGWERILQLHSRPDRVKTACITRTGL